MEWKKAKNYTIIILLVLNLILCVLNLVKSNATRLDTESVRSLSAVLSQKNITLNCDLPTNFSPMGQLYMRAYEYDEIELQEVFFGELNGVRRTQSDSQKVFARDEGTLTVSDNSVVFEGVLGGFEDELESTAAAVDEYVKRLNNDFTDYSINITDEVEDGYYFEYRQRFRNKAVFSNYLKAWVKQDGTVKITFNYQQPVEYKGTREDIISADEAIYSAVPTIVKSFTTASVDKVELGYYLVERTGSGELAAVPHYKVYVNGGTVAYYVNAYSGDVTED